MSQKRHRFGLPVHPDAECEIQLKLAATRPTVRFAKCMDAPLSGVAALLRRCVACARELFFAS